MTFRLLLLLAAFLHAGCCFMPSRVGQLLPSGAPNSVTGLVFLLNHTAIYIRDFQFNLADRGVFCAGSSTSDVSDAYEIPSLPFQNGYSSADIELQLPEGRTVASVGWIGVCNVEMTRILANVIVQPETITKVPCETTFIGELPPGSNGLAGRVYLLNRVTFAVLGFSYDGQAEDAFFWVGDGESPSISGYGCTYNQDINTRLPAVDDQDVVVHLPPEAEGEPIEHFAIWCRSNNINIGHIPVPKDIIPTISQPPMVLANSPVFLGNLSSNAHDVQGNVYALDERTLMLTEFFFDGDAPATRFYAVRGPSVESPESWTILDEDGSAERLSAYTNATIVLTLPDEITIHTIDWFSIWCVTARVSFGELQVPDNITFNIPVPDSAVFLGNLTNRAHEVQGNVYALDERTLMLTEFFYDGGAPATRFYAVRGPSVNSPEFWFLLDENGSAERLSAYTNATIVLTLPDEITIDTIDWFSVWCVTVNVSFGELQVPDNITFNIPVPDSAVFLGNLTNRAHEVQGNVYALDERTLMITEFFYDGGAPATRFYAVRGPSVNSPESWFLLDENGSAERLSAYTNATIVLTLPDEITIDTIDWFSVWCVSVNVSFGELQVPDNITFNIPVPESAVFLGNLTNRAHEVQGNVYALNDRTLMLTEFFYDGGAPATRFYAVRGPSVNSPEFWFLLDENGSAERLSAYTNATIVLTLPDEITIDTIDWFSVWCVSVNVSFGELQIPDDIQLPDSAVFLGNLTNRAHEVRGNVFALDERTVMLTEFFYDGGAPATRFYAVRGPSVNSPEFWFLLDENGSAERLSAYTNATIVITLPDEITIHTIDWFSVWCVSVNVSFGELQVPGDLPTFAPTTTIPTMPPVPTLPPVEECPTLESQQPVNCKQLTDDIKMSWVIDRITDTIYITLCGCVLPDNYIAFGLSGHVGRVQMVRGDVTWTWLDSEGVHAQDLDLSAYAQCFMRRRRGDGRIIQNGVCPDVQNDVFSVSGFREGCTTCIKYARPLRTTDRTDIPFLLDQEQYVIWSMGPVGTLETPLGTTIPVPFRHFARASSTDNLRVNFSRTPVDECNLQCSGCEVAVQPWPRPVLQQTTTINARIGQSGSEKGYAGITGTSGWGIAWYLNNLLIPDMTVYRGTTYTFIVEGGINPNNNARYHPFYITDSQRGGYLAKGPGDRQRETVYAGFDADGEPLGVGRYCEYKNKADDRSIEFDTFEEYKSTLKLECDEGEPGRFTWTPDENTPDTVYYQCATHQFLGWSMQVRDAVTVDGGPTVDPPTVPGDDDGDDSTPVVVEGPTGDLPIPGDDDFGPGNLNIGGFSGDVRVSSALRLIVGALSFTILILFSL